MTKHGGLHSIRRSVKLKYFITVIIYLYLLTFIHENTVAQEEEPPSSS